MEEAGQRPRAGEAGERARAEGEAGERPRAGAGPVGSGGLPDILWGQCALFQFVRMQDDLLDGHLTDLEAQFVADRFLVESLEAFQGIPALGEAFWDGYRSALRDTADGILEVRRLEAEAGGFTVGELGLHAKVAAVLGVGAAAVCHSLGRPTDLAWVRALQDGLAVASQVADDLRDLREDLQAGRFTFVANVLLDLPGGEPLEAAERDERLRAGLLDPSRSERVWEAVREVAGPVEERVPESAPPPVLELVRSLRDAPDALERVLHEGRVRSIFGEAVLRKALEMRGREQ